MLHDYNWLRTSYLYVCTIVYQWCQLLIWIVITATFTKNLTDVLAPFGSEVQLECAISNPSADCKWYKNGNLVDGALVKTSDHQRNLRFISISHDDDGEYECRCGDESTKARAEVKGMQ